MIDKDIYVAVPFPESQYFMKPEYKDRISLINDVNGRERYGHAAYFVKLELYLSVRPAIETDLRRVARQRRGR